MSVYPESHAAEVSLNRAVAPLVERLLADAGSLRVGVERGVGGAVIVDAGIEHRGGLEAGRRIAEICLGGLGSVTLTGHGAFRRWPLTLHVHTGDPVLACLGSQYAGWSLSHGEGKGAFHALGSGPGRALAVKEPLFAELGYRDRAERGCLVLEVERVPPVPVIEKIVRDCGLARPEDLTLILTPTRSLAGGVQIVARVLEVALHKVHELGFPLADVVDGFGSAPLPPPAVDFVRAMGRTNDAILFGGQVQLFVRGEDAAAQDLAARLPSSTSRDYGAPFAEVFERYHYDFYQIDPMLFSPAQVIVTALESGSSFHAGELNHELLERSFGGAL
ncbi:MAG: methenyltetrahydromethanopterin cyclohydrolase [Thiotrichales bacterium]